MPNITINDMSHAEPVATRDYRVVVTDAEGVRITDVTITVNWQTLQTLARRAVENTSGVAELYYGAVKAVCK